MMIAYVMSPLGKDLREVTGFNLSFKHCKRVLMCGKAEDDEEEEEETVLPTSDNMEDPLMNENTSLVIPTVMGGDPL